MSAVACSCGVPGCPELGWPHEWDPIAAGDSCSAVPPPAFVVALLGREPGEPTEVYASPHPHKVTEPYVRHGSGYACAACVERYAA